MKRMRRVLPVLAGAVLASAGTAMGAPAAELEIQHQVPTARNTRDASTYTNSTMKLVNTGTVAITGMSMDLQPGATVLPDLVFDPTDGTPAGDVVTKPFTVNSAPSGMAASASYGAPPCQTGRCSP